MPILYLTFQFLFYVRYEATLYCHLSTQCHVLCQNQKSNQISESQSLYTFVRLIYNCNEKNVLIKELK